jgi:hypothetical protein
MDFIVLGGALMIIMILMILMLMILMINDTDDELMMSCPSFKNILTLNPEYLTNPTSPTDSSKHGNSAPRSWWAHVLRPRAGGSRGGRPGLAPGRPHTHIAFAVCSAGTGFPAARWVHQCVSLCVCMCVCMSFLCVCILVSAVKPHRAHFSIALADTMACPGAASYLLALPAEHEIKPILAFCANVTSIMVCRVL